MGKPCVRFKTLEDLPIDLIGEAVARTTVDELVEQYETSRAQTAERRRTSRRRDSKGGPLEPSPGGLTPRRGCLSLDRYRRDLGWRGDALYELP